MKSRHFQRAESRGRAPDIIPEGWVFARLANGSSAAWNQVTLGLTALLSIDQMPGDPTFADGEWVHISLSRKNRYPSWDEMRDFIYDCGFFDNDRDVVMALPRRSEYVNIHDNCFHFYQRRRE